MDEFVKGFQFTWVKRRAEQARRFFHKRPEICFIQCMCCGSRLAKSLDWRAHVCKCSNWTPSKERCWSTVIFFCLLLSIGGILEVALTWLTSLMKYVNRHKSFGMNLFPSHPLSSWMLIYMHSYHWCSSPVWKEQCKALTRALRHNHDTIKIILQRLLVARKAIFTACNRVWLSD